MTSLSEKRIKQNLMQADIAEAVGVNRATVSKWETGEIIPHTKKIPKLAEAYNCTVEEIIAATVITNEQTQPEQPEQEGGGHAESP